MEYSLHEVYGFSNWMQELKQPTETHVRNPEERYPTCDECLMGCCISMEFGLSSREYNFLIRGGNVFVRNIGTYMTLEDGDMLYLYPQIEKAVIDANSLKERELRVALQRLTGRTQMRTLPASFRKAIDFYRQQQREMIMKKERLECGIMGICGYIIHSNLLKRPYHCSIHSKYPKACANFEMREEKCQRHFISKRAPIAREVISRANRIEPTLHFLSLLYGISARKIRTYRL